MLVKNSNGIFIPKYLLPILVILIASILGVGLKAVTSISRAEAIGTFVNQQEYREDIKMINQKLDRLIVRGNR